MRCGRPSICNEFFNKECKSLDQSQLFFLETVLNLVQVKQDCQSLIPGVLSVPDQQVLASLAYKKVEDIQKNLSVQEETNLINDWLKSAASLEVKHGYIVQEYLSPLRVYCDSNLWCSDLQSERKTLQSLRADDGASSLNCEKDPLPLFPGCFPLTISLH